LTICIAGAAMMGALYSLFPLGEASTEEYLSLWKMNAADLRVWWRHDFGTTLMRDASLVPTAIPMPILWFSTAMIILGLPRSLPWALAGLLMLNLSLGLNDKLPVHLSYWIGSFGYPIGNQILNINAHLYAFPGLGEIRFPQRWLIPSAMCFVVGGSLGLQRLGLWIKKQSWGETVLKGHTIYATLLVALGTFVCVRTSQIDLHFPKQSLPHIQFATYLAEQPENGGLIMLPQMRPPPKSGKRSDLPVFANLADSLSSSDVQYFQTIHGKAIYDKPGLKTLYAFEGSEYVYRLVREWDDLAHPMVTGNPIPASAYDERFTKRRRKGLKELIDAGLKWVVVDLGAYNAQALEILDKQLSAYETGRETFDEGDGVLIIALSANPNIIAVDAPELAPTKSEAPSSETVTQ